MKHVSDPPPRPSQFNEKIPPEIDQIILKALAKNPAERFPSGAAFETALRFWQDPLPARNRPPAGRSANRPVRATTGRAERDRDRGRSGRPPRGPTAGPPPPRRRRNQQAANELGCATWFIGVLLLTVIVGVVLALLQWGPGLIEANPSDSDPTPTVTASSPGGAITTPTAEPTLEPTPTVPEATPTALPEPTATEAPTEGSVPELRNLRVSEARSAVAGRWTLNQLEEFHPTIEPGLIIRQEPAPETMLAFESEVTIWVSKGPAIIQIPQIVDMPEAQAVEELESAGFEVVVEQEASESVAAGNATRTEPEGEAEIGDTVTLFISLGDVVVIPDLFGVDVFEARDALVEEGLVVRNVIPRTCELLQRLNPDFDCETVEPNTVVSISSGSEPLDWGDVVDRGTEVDLVYLQELASP